MKSSSLKYLTLAAALCNPWLTAKSASNTWTGAVNSAWDTTTANWSNGTFSTYDAAIFDTTGAGAIAVDVGGVTVGDIKIMAPGYSISGGPLTIASGVAGTPGDLRIYAAGGTTTTISSAFNFTNSNSFYVGYNNFASDWDGTLNFTGGGNVGPISGDHADRDLFVGFYNNSQTNFQAGTYYANGLFITGNMGIGAATMNIGYFRAVGNGNLVHVNDPSAQLNVAYSFFNDDDMVVGSNDNSATLQLTQGTINSAGGLTVTNVDSGGASSPKGGTLLVEGGTLNVGAAGITLIRATTTNSFGDAIFTVTGGTVNTSAINFGGGNSAGQGNSATLNIQGGTVYVGSGGIQKTANAAPTNTANLSGGTVAASADWTSNMDFTLSNAQGGVTFKAAAANNSAHNITLNGILSGSGTLTKTGAGVLTITAANTYQGGTVVSGGTLSVSATGSLGTGDVSLGSNITLVLQNPNAIADTAHVSFASTSTINLDFVGSETIFSLFDSSTNQYFTPNTYTATELNSFLGGGSTFTGGGSLTITAVPEPAVTGLLGIGLAFSAIAFRRRAKS